MRHREAVLKVLQLLEEKQITPQEAEALLRALEGGPRPRRPEAPTVSAPSGFDWMGTLRNLFKGRTKAPPPEARHALSYELTGVERLEIRTEGGGLSVQAEPNRTVLEGTTDASETWEVQESTGLLVFPSAPWATSSRVQVPDHLPLTLHAEGAGLTVKGHRAPLKVIIEGGKGVVEEHHEALELRVFGGRAEVLRQAGPVGAEVQGGKILLQLLQVAPVSVEVQGGALELQVPKGASFRVEPQVEGGVIRFDEALRARLRREGSQYVVGEQPEAAFHLTVQGGQVKIREVQE